MTYPSIDDEKFLERIASKKEFATYFKATTPTKTGNRIDLNALLRRKQVFLQSSYQSLIRHFINPNTPYKRMLIMWEPGAGKTLGAIGDGLEFMDNIRLSADPDKGWIFIIGFSEKVFKDEMLKYPQLGFITEHEIKHIRRIKDLYRSTHQVEYGDKLKELYAKIKRRFGNRKGNGYFKFFGYRELVNRLFVATDRKYADLTNFSGDEIQKMVTDGRLKVDQDLLSQFENSLVICDECHNVYNSMAKNNWGIALKYVFMAKQPHVLLLSATPLENSPTEVIDLADLLTAGTDMEPPKKSDIFGSGDKLLPGALAKLRSVFRGRVSFVRSAETGQFPDKEIVGEEIKDIPYLKFERCQMSSFHYNTYQHAYKEYDSHKPEMRILNDIAYPNPASEDVGLYAPDSNVTISQAPQRWKLTNGIDWDDSADSLRGSFLQATNLKKYSNKDFTMVKMIHELIKKQSGKLFIYHNNVHSSGVIFIGEILKANGIIELSASSNNSTLCVICGKLKADHEKEARGGGDDVECVSHKNKSIWTIGCDTKTIVEYLKKDIYEMKATTVNMTSPDFEKNINFVLRKLRSVNPDAKIKLKIDEEDITTLKPILEKIGFTVIPSLKGDVVFFLAPPKENVTKTHRFPKNVSGGTFRHKFVPARYALLYNSVSKTHRGQIIDLYNSEENVNGEQLAVIVGSPLIQEAYNFTAIQHMLIMSRPDNIPSLKQLLGRGVRQGSHINLPPERRKVWIHIFVSSIPGFATMSVEEQRYKEKIESYLTIQEIERAIHEVSLEPLSILPGNEFDILPYKNEMYRIRVSNDDLDMSSFNSLYADEEFKDMLMLIKRLFVEVSTIWSADTLWGAIQDPPFRVELDTKMLQKDIFDIALNSLVHSNDSNVTMKYQDPIMEKLLMSSVDKNVTIDGVNLYAIVKLSNSEFYILAPLLDGAPVIDIDVPFRSFHAQTKQYLDVRWYLKNIRPTHDFGNKLDKFVQKWKDIPLNHMDPVVCEFDLEFHIKLVEKAIGHMCDILINRTKADDMFGFYTKMIFYYDVHGLIMWADCASNQTLSTYKKYLDMSERKILDDPEKIGSMHGDNVSNYIKKTLNTMSMRWIPSEHQAHITSNISAMLHLTKRAKTAKIPAELLPVGHFLADRPRAVNIFAQKASMWSVDDTYTATQGSVKENPITIGYDDRRLNSLYVQFKLRPPIGRLTTAQATEVVKHETDARKIKKGNVCGSMSKSKLEQLAVRLHIKISDRNIGTLCKQIRYRLIYNELKERIHGSKLRWFYFVYERKPLL